MLGFLQSLLKCQFSRAYCVCAVKLGIDLKQAVVLVNLIIFLIYAQSYFYTFILLFLYATILVYSSDGRLVKQVAITFRQSKASKSSTVY